MDVTIAGYTSADIATGRLTIGYGRTVDTLVQVGLPFMQIIARQQQGKKLEMRTRFLLGTCLALLSSPSFARDGGGGVIGSFLGGAAGAAVGTLLTQPQAPAPVYVAPQRIYVAPQYVVPQRVYIGAQPAYTLQAQQRLHDLGLLYGPVDGVYGEATRRAILNWQSLHTRPATGYLSNDDLALLLPEMQPTVVVAPVAPPVVMPAIPVAVAPQAVPVQALPPPPMQTQPVSAPVNVMPSDPYGGVKNGMPYGQARQRLAAAGWQTGFFTPDKISESDRDNRAYFSDHHIMEVEDCSASGCAMQFHNNDGRLLYVFTETGSRSSDAYRGAGPAVIGFCLDRKDMACQADVAPTQAQAQAAR